MANPTPGSRVEAGNDVVQGVAFDKSTTNSSGIDRVDFFLDNRDEGGLSIGSAVPALTPGPFGPGSFQTTLSLPSNLIGGHDLFAYAHDSVTGQESVISVPIAVGEDPSKAFVTPPADTVTQTCSGSAMPTTPSTATTTAPMTSATGITTTAPSASVAPTAQTITLDVGNPSPGDTVHSGDYVIQGVAFDRSATSGSGIDRVDIFIDNRDEGGTFLGTAALGQNNLWTATVTLPPNQLGLHTLFFYAHSSVTGRELPVSVPVTIAM